MKTAVATMPITESEVLRSMFWESNEDEGMSWKAYSQLVANGHTLCPS